MVDITGFARFLRRAVGGAAGSPALKSGQGFMNEGENGGVFYYGAGDDGSKNATSILKVGGVGAFVDLASAQTVAGKKTFNASPTVPNGSGAFDAMAFGQLAAALAAYATLASPAFTGTPTAPTPSATDNSTSLATTSWTQALVAAVVAGLTPKATSTVATAAALPAYTYANGVLTASANGALTIDGYAVAVGDIPLVLNETGANAAYNGQYVVQQAGSSSTGWVLKRHVDMAIASEFPGALVPVGNAGATTANSLWLCNPAKSFTLGTTAVPFTQLNSPTQLLAGAGVSIAGNTIAVLGWASVTAGALIKMTASGLAPAVAGTDYVAPFSSIDPGTA